MPEACYPAASIIMFKFSMVMTCIVGVILWTVEYIRNYEQDDNE